MLGAVVRHDREEPVQVPVRHVARRQGAGHNRDLSKPIFLTLTKLRTLLLNVSRNRAADEAAQTQTFRPQPKGRWSAARRLSALRTRAAHAPAFHHHLYLTRARLPRVRSRQAVSWELRTRCPRHASWRPYGRASGEFRRLL